MFRQFFFFGLILLPISLVHAAACDLDANGKALIEGDQVLSQMHSKLVKHVGSDSQDCEYLDQVNSQIKTYSADQNSVSPFKQCDMKREIALSYMQAFNRYLERECLDMDCSPMKQDLEASSWIGTLGDHIFFYEDSLRSSHEIFKTSQETFSRWIIEGRSPFSGCAELSVDLIYAGAPFKDSDDALNLLLDKGLKQDILDLKYHRIPLQAFWANLRSSDGEPAVTVNVHQSVMFKSYGIISIETEMLTDFGGAHPSHELSMQNIDLGKKRAIRLDDIFDETKQQALVAAVKNQLFQWAKQTYPEQDNPFNFDLNQVPKDSKHWVDEQGFYISDQFQINEAGIVFLYPKYQIAPGYMGMIKVKLDYRELDSFIKIDSVLSSMLNE